MVMEESISASTTPSFHLEPLLLPSLYRAGTRSGQEGTPGAGMWRPKYSERKRQEAAWILTSCILLHSSVGLLQGVGCGGALCCKKAKE